ncbi:transcriptional repressor [Dehalococcoidia bacterium]|nr:transcriptional repressor [Dehalococcoidia bacterium]
MIPSINAFHVATHPELIAVFEDMGHRVTQPRRQILSLLEMKPDGFDAEQIIRELPMVGRATVYRTIRILLEAGVVCKLSLRDGTTKYSLARVEHHHHVLCVHCGTVREFRDSTIERLVRSIGREVSGEILGHRIEFDIVCQDCLSAT